jgi:hypothetical protein
MFISQIARNVPGAVRAIVSGWYDVNGKGLRLHTRDGQVSIVGRKAIHTAEHIGACYLLRRGEVLLGVYVSVQGQARIMGLKALHANFAGTQDLSVEPARRPVAVTPVACRWDEDAERQTAQQMYGHE